MVLYSLEEAAKELAGFGLTGNQAKVYVALVKLRVAPVSRIAQVSKVRREEVYRAMPKLERLGLVEKILGKPIKYTSIPPKEALSFLFKLAMKNAQAKIAELGEKRRQLLGRLRSLRVETRAEEEEGPHFVLILDREQAVRKIAKMIGKAGKSIAIATPRYGVEFGYAYADVFTRAVRKGVKARILLKVDELDNLTIKMLRDAESLKGGVELRHVENLTSHTIIVDDAQVMVGTFLMPTAEKHVDLWTNSPAYVDVMKAFFDKVWQDSVDIKSRIDYLQTGKPVEKTLVFKNPKEAFEKTVELFRSAKEGIFVTTIPGRITAFLRNYPIRELQDKGVAFRLLVPITTENVNEAKELSKYCELKHIDKIGAMMGIIDREHLVFLRSPPSDVSNNPEYKEHFKEMMYTNDRGHVDHMMTLAEELWNLGVDGRERIRELETGKPVERTEVIKGKAAIYEIGYAIYSRAKTEKLVTIDGSGLELVVRDFTSANIEVKKRGVRIRYLTSVTPQNLKFAEALSKYAEVRHADNVLVGSLLTESEALFSWVPITEMPDSAIYSNNAEMVNILWKIAENFWDNAIDAQSRIEEISKGKPIGRVSKPSLEVLESRMREM